MKARKPALILVDDNVLIKTLALECKDYAIGRASISDFLLDGKEVSRNHAQLTCQHGQYVIQDLVSANGTFLNGKRVNTQVLKHGDEIGIGEFKIIFDDGRGINGISDQTQVETPGEETRSLVGHYRSLAKKIRHRDAVDELNIYHRKVLKSRKKLELLANQDRLTGLFNRRFFDRVITEQLTKAEIDKAPLSLIFIDIDFFKKINDTFGHDKGDEALKIVAQLIRSALRKDDIVARYGGEEFVALCANMSSRDAFAAAEALRKIIEETTPDVLNIKLTVSAGIATYPEHCQTHKELITRADHALYQAKSAGRNRVVKYNA